ncbi:MFS transporter [Aestuariivirga sp.]|uniref:MFS transporter n=1 Tax=Aestuariivirga sp. TaxID=2650926 RepID=UPI0035944A5C
MPSRFIASSPRAAILAVFTSFGAAVGALAGSMPSIMRNAGIDAETMGLGLTMSTLMTVSAMSLGGQVARFASNRAVLLAVFPAFGLFLFAYLTAQSPLWFYMAIIPMGVCFGLTDLFMNAEAVAIEHDMRRPVFTAFHGSVSAGVAAAAIASSFISTLLGTWATGLLVIALFALAWNMVWRGIPTRALAKRKTAEGRSTLRIKTPLVLLGISAGLIIAAETAALLWSAKLLDEQAPALAAVAGLGAAFYGVCNAAVRFPGDRLRSYFGDMPLMIGSLVVSIGGFAALGFTKNFAASVAAFAAVGLGTALLIPCIFAMAANFSPENRAGGLSFVSLLTAAPRTLAPWFFGLVAAGFGTSAAFSLVALGLVAALVLIITLKHTGKHA